MPQNGVLAQNRRNFRTVTDHIDIYMIDIDGLKVGNLAIKRNPILIMRRFGQMTNIHSNKD